VPGLDITKLVAIPPWLQKAPLWWCLYFIGSRNSSAQNFRVAWFRSPLRNLVRCLCFIHANGDGWMPNLLQLTCRSKRSSFQFGLRVGSHL